MTDEAALDSAECPPGSGGEVAMDVDSAAGEAKVEDAGAQVRPASVAPSVAAAAEEMEEGEEPSSSNS